MLTRLSALEAEAKPSCFDASELHSLDKTREENAQSVDWAFLACRSLTMTYFHTRMRTIIGAEAFHCPVRDGKEWDHLAMVVRHNRWSFRLEPERRFVESDESALVCQLIAFTVTEVRFTSTLLP